MTVGWDANGYPYDTYTGNLVNLEYDVDGNAIDANTGQTIEHVLAPDNTTVYDTSTTTLSQILQYVGAQLGHAPSVSYYPPNYPSGGYPTTRLPGGVSATAALGGSGATGQITISKNTAIIGGMLILIVFLARKK